MGGPRSRADRYGQLTFVLIVTGLFAWLLTWLGTVTWETPWLFWPLAVVAVPLWLLLLVTGVVSALRKTADRRS